VRRPIQKILEKGQGKRLQELMVAQNIRSRSEFARIVGVSTSSINEVIWGHKEIKANLLFKIAYKFPDLDTEWLLTGNKSKLSTTPPEVIRVDNVEENAEKYITLQKLLDEKERYILSLEDRVASQIMSFICHERRRSIRGIRTITRTITASAITCHKIRSILLRSSLSLIVIISVSFSSITLIAESSFTWRVVSVCHTFWNKVSCITHAWPCAVPEDVITDPPTDQLNTGL
jgi:plasmid maintenance system antidote protein VapI